MKFISFFNKNKFIFNHTISFYIIFLIEFLERFSYYGFQSILIIYFVRYLNFTESESIIIFTSFSALICGFVFIGGWIGDKILGLKRTIILGSIILLIGYIIMSIADKNIFLIYLSMSLIITGNGIFKSNPSALISYIYNKNKKMLDSAYTIYYMSINIGSFLSIIISPFIVYKFGWNKAFFVSSIFLFIMLISFIYCYKYFYNIGSDPDFKSVSTKSKILISILLILLIYTSYFLIKFNYLIKYILILMFILSIFKLMFETINSTKYEKKLLIVSYIIIIESILFFIMYGQMPTSLNFFSINHVRTNMFGINFKPEQFQSLNPMWITLLSPIFILYHDTIGKNFNTMYKFIIGMILSSFSFLILSYGIMFHDNNFLISPYWLLISYLLQSSGELLISSLGLSIISKLVPKRLISFMIGFWFLINSFSIILSGNLANLMYNKKNNNILRISIIKYRNFFLNIGICSILFSLFMIYISYKINNFLKKNNINIM